MDRTARKLASGLLMIGLGALISLSNVSSSMAAEAPARQTIAPNAKLLDTTPMDAPAEQAAHRSPNWRYRYHNGRWWYWTPNNYWMYYGNNGWRRHGGYYGYGNRYYGYGNRYYGYGNRYYGYRNPYRGYGLRYGAGYRGGYWGPGVGWGVGRGYGGVGIGIY